MQDLFHGFYKLTDEEYSQLFKECLFILDTSFLCGLYRLPLSVSDELMTIINKVSDRIWVPYFVALEFQRNRLGTISDQKTKITETRRIFEDIQREFRNKLGKLNLQKRHSLINVEDFETHFNALIESFECFQA